MHPDHRSYEKKHGHVCRAGLLVTRCDAPEALDCIDEAFDEVPFLVDLLVMGDELGPGPVRQCSVRCSGRPQPFPVVVAQTDYTGK